MDSHPGQGTANKPRKPPPPCGRPLPVRIPVIEPSGLNACEKLRRRSELCGSPSCAMNILEAVFRS